MKRLVTTLALRVRVVVVAVVLVAAAAASASDVAVAADAATAAEAPPAPVNLAGTWNVEGDVVGNAVKFAMTLKQTGEKLSGTAAINGQQQPVTGSVKERVATFEFDVNHEGTTYHNVYTGTLKEDGLMEGKIEVAGVEGAFTAKKQ